jgi:hypothetical protein
VKWFDTVEYSIEPAPEWWEFSYKQADKYLAMLDDIPKVALSEIPRQTRLIDGYGIMQRAKMK